MRRKLVRIGNSVGVTLPSEMLQACGLHEGQTIDIQVSNGHIELRPENQDLGALFDSWTPIGQPIDSELIVQLIREDRESH